MTQLQIGRVGEAKLKTRNVAVSEGLRSTDLRTLTLSQPYHWLGVRAARACSDFCSTE